MLQEKMPGKWLFSALLIMFCCGCSERKRAIPEVSAEHAYQLAAKLVAFGKRYAGSEENKRQAEFIIARASESGTAVSADRFSGLTPNGTIEFNNITAEIKGRSQDFIIIGCHYDIKQIPTVPEFAGANDGAAATALLLEMMRVIAASGIQPPLTLKFVFFDGEECLIAYSDHDGLWGSRRCAAELKKKQTKQTCRGVIVLDMIGDAELGVTLPANSDRRLAEMLLKAARDQGVSHYFSITNFELLDDHQPFLDNGIPAINIVDFEYGPNNIFWHTGADRMDKISGKSQKIVGDCVLKLVLSSEYW